MILRRLLLLLGVAGALLACATHPTPQNLGWKQDMPQFHMRKLEWNVVYNGDGLGRQRVANLCRLQPSDACAIRIVEGGQCVVFSIYTEEEARRIQAQGAFWSLWEHEVEGHCGAKVGGGWNHK